MHQNASYLGTITRLLAGSTLTLLLGCPVPDVDSPDLAATDSLLPVTVVKMGDGTVSSEPAGISCGTQCNTEMKSGTALNLTATPGPGYLFAGWGGACSGMEPVCTVTVDRALSVTAAFAKDPIFSLTVSNSGGGSVSSAPAGISCGDQCLTLFKPHSAVNLSAQPNPGNLFLGWRGACSGSSPACTVIMDQPVTVTALFGKIPSYTLTVSNSGGGGVVTSAPSGISCGTQCSAQYTDGTSVNLTPVPATNWIFTGWGGDCAGSGTNCTLRMSTNRTATASFALQPCEVRRGVIITPTTHQVEYVPPWTGGADREFHGHGPCMNGGVNLSHTSYQISAAVSLDAYECDDHWARQSDYTEASGSKSFPIWSPPSGYKITGLSSTADPYSFRDVSPHGPKPASGHGPVAQYTFYGDTDIEYDAGLYTKVVVDFASLAVDLTQDHDCR